MAAASSISTESDIAESFRALKAHSSPDSQFEASKLFCHADRVIDWLEGRPFAPVTLELDVSLICNDRCPTCVHGFAHSRRFLALRDVDRILAEASELGIRGVTLSGGGEPLCHPEIERILQMIRQRNLVAGLITNGGMVRSDQLAQKLISTFQWIRVSLDSASEERFRDIRGVRGFATRLECLQRLSSARHCIGSDCELGVSFLTCADATHEVVKVTEIVGRLGFDYVQFKPLIDWNLSTHHHQSTGRSQDGVFAAVLRAKDLEADGFEVLWSDKKYSAEALHRRVSYSAFHSAWFIVSVAPSTCGDARPTLYLDCSSKYLRRWTIGEFDSLKAILKSDARRRMIEKTSSEEYCVPPEKHSAYNSLLEAVRERNSNTRLTRRDIVRLAPQGKHEAFL